jgi:ABC-2 type transport system ATP-binding protein
MPVAISTTELTKRYGSSRGIDRVDLEVHTGEVFGFLGPNGAGKTTTIRLLLDFHRATSGRATVLGLDSHREHLEVHRRVGYVPGDLSLYGKMRGADLLAWFAKLRGGVPAGSVDALCERFAVEVDRPIASLSKGNRQKIGLVQAFMHEPDLLVLDEPTSGLDPLVQDEFHHLVREVAAEGRTVFLSSHSLDEVQHVADRVGVIRDGRLVATEVVEVLRDRAIREIDIHVAEPVTAEDFAGLPGVQDVVVADDGRVHLSATGELDALIKAVARFHVLDLLSQPADLDEIFLTYYRDDDDGA